MLGVFLEVNLANASIVGWFFLIFELSLYDNSVILWKELSG